MGETAGVLEEGLEEGRPWHTLVTLGVHNRPLLTNSRNNWFPLSH